MVTLINRQPLPQVFNLDTSYFQKDGTPIRVLIVEETRDGQQRPRRIRKSVCPSLTLLAKEKRSGLPDQVLAVPAIKAAIEAKRLAYIKVKETAAVATTNVPASKAAKPSSKKKSK